LLYQAAAGGQGGKAHRAVDSAFFALAIDCPSPETPQSIAPPFGKAAAPYLKERAPMAMPELDRSRFIRILKLTASPNDSEALSAVRRANSMLHAAGLSWDRLHVLPPEADAEPQATKDGQDPFWADASMFFPGNWSSDPMMPLGKRNAVAQAYARLRSAALRLRLALLPAWTAAAMFMAGCIEKSRLRDVMGRSQRFVRVLGRRALQAGGTGGIRLKHWARFKRKT
jgi:hypothetical protein